MTNADKDNKSSVRIAAEIARTIGAGSYVVRPSGQTLGVEFERRVRSFVEAAFAELGHLNPGPWSFAATAGKGSASIKFEQYSHLDALNALVSTQRKIQAALGNNYVIAPDVIVLRHPVADSVINKSSHIVDGQIATRSAIRADLGASPSLHASISCKWTFRSDRAQNARSEGLNLVRNRKGRAPHIVVVTAEPTPSRIASLALGTGDIDCVYHFALPELESAVASLGMDDAADLLGIMVDGKRLKDIADLPLDLML